MAIKTNLKSLAPARDKFKKEITLLSHGYSMPDLIPGGVITVYPWDQAVDDFVMKKLRTLSPERLVYEAVKKLVSIEKIDRMVVGDVVTICHVARALARDSTIVYDSVCPACSHSERITLSVPDQLEKIAEKSPEYVGWDAITLPLCKDVVKIRPLLVRDELSILDSPEINATGITKKIARAIAALVSVNDGVPESVGEAATYFNALAPADLTYYHQQMDALTPHLGSEIKHKCASCSHEYSHDINLGADFFR